MKPTPPVRRAADVVRSTVQLMTRLGCGGHDHVARLLARAGWRVSARSVGRYRKERPAPEPTLPQEDSHPPSRPVVARFVHHVWMMDVSRAQQLLGPDLHMAAVFDAFSRVPLVLQAFARRPGAAEMARLLMRAARRFARPRHVITDLGGEFTGAVFRDAVARLGASHRFASKDSLRATARLERFWRTVKEAARLRRLQLPLTVADLERRLELALLHYVVFRPHAGLGGATPLETFLGEEPAHAATVEPPRGRPGEPRPDPPFEIHFLDPVERRFPILKRAA